MTTTSNALAPMTAHYLARVGVSLTSNKAIDLADGFAHGDLGAINALSAIAHKGGDRRLARLARWMGELTFRGAFDPLAPMASKEAWEAVEACLWTEEAEEAVRGSWFTEEV